MKRHFEILLVLSSLLLWLTPLRAQQDNSYPSYNQSGNQNPNENPSQAPYGPGKIEPDDRPLSGAEYLTLGIPERDRNVLNASIQVDERADSNSGSAGTGTSWTADTDLYGNAILNRSWKRNLFTAQYDGGASYYGESDLQSVQFFKASQVIGWQRMQLTLTDQVTYSPEAPFGYAGPLTFSIIDVGTKPELVPNQTILTSEATRVSNVSLAQADFGLSRRSSLTLLGSYGILDYFSNNVVNSDQINGTVGYNFALTAHNKVSVSYGYEDIKFLDNTNGNSQTEIQTPAISYAFQATGRMSLQLSAGAQLVRSFSPGSPVITNLYPYGQAVITYAWHRTQLGLLGQQAVVSGGGLYPASRNTLAQASLARQLSRKWQAALVGGYARNEPVQTYLGLTNQLSQTGFAGATARRSLGRHAGIYFLYNFQRQQVNTFCTGALCAPDFLRHTVGVGLDWRFSPWYFHVMEQ